MSGRRATIPLSGHAAEIAIVSDMTIDGRGVANLSGKRVFIPGAIAGETVRFQRRRRRHTWDEADLLGVLQPVAARAVPRCEYFGRCGGCALQHLEPAAQLQLKERVLLENLRRIGHVAPACLLPPVAGPVWGYRRRARLAVRHVSGKGRVLVGFREQLKPYVTDMLDCHTLHPKAARLIAPLSDLIGGLSLRARLPQVEVAVGDNATALVMRVLDEPTATDLAALGAFRDQQDVCLFLQRTDPGEAEPLDPCRDGADLWYELSEWGLRITFGPLDFVQVNAEINRRLVGLAVELLAPEPAMRVLDLFSGVGNFTLALARRAGWVTGVELNPGMVARASTNAALNDIRNVEFHAADLAQSIVHPPWSGRHFDLVLLDPPRTGAQGALPVIGQVQAVRILYVSCHPATLARDAGLLVAQYGYELTAAGVLDMFPGTGHVESVALFERR